MSEKAGWAVSLSREEKQIRLKGEGCKKKKNSFLDCELESHRELSPLRAPSFINILVHKSA